MKAARRFEVHGLQLEETFPREKKKLKSLMKHNFHHQSDTLPQR